ncbi:MAG: hypothetical protein RI990_1584 [Planctomycetota bacterium]
MARRSVAWSAWWPAVPVAAITVAVVAFVAAVAWPGLAAVPILLSPSVVPDSFDGAATARITLAWAAGVATVATLAGWPVGRAIRGSRWSSALLVLSVVAASLPPYAVFWSWWQAVGPGSAPGDWIAATGRSLPVRTALLALGLVSWSWPIVAWCVAMRSGVDREARELGALDAERWLDRLARAWREDRAALLVGMAAIAFAVAGSTVAFDLAQVRTWGFELRALDAQGVPANAVLVASWPAIALAAVCAVVAATLPVRARPEAVATWRPDGIPVAAAMVVAVAVLAPVAVLVLAVASRGALDRFASTGLRGATGTVLAAGCAGAVLACVAVAHLALAARGRGAGRGARIARVAERVALAAWTVSAVVPATVVAVALVAAWNRAWVGPLVFDTPAIVVVCHVSRFGVVAAWIGRVPALREPTERRDLREVDGPGLASTAMALAPEARGAALAAMGVCSALSAGEVIAAARIEPPGWSWSASSILNAIHYQHPATVLGGLLAVLVLAVLGGIAVARTMVRIDRARAALLVAAVAILPVLVGLGGCRDPGAGSGGPQISADHWFGASGRGRGQFEYPRAMDVDPRDGSIVVIDRRARVQRFREDGAYVGEWSMPEDERGKPTGFGIGPDGRVWVADTHYHRVIAYAPDGTELLRIGGYGTGPGEFIYPCDAEVGPDGNVWVAEFGGNDRIQVFAPDGTFVRAIGGPGRDPGRFDRPQSIGFLPQEAGGPALVVCDACNHRVQVLDLDGTPRAQWGTAGAEAGQLAYPYGLEVLPDGTALVTEFGNHRLQRIDLRTGRSRGVARRVGGAPVPRVLHVLEGDRVRSLPSGENALRFPWAVAVHGDRMIVLDSGHSRVLTGPLAAFGDGASDTVREAP